MRHQIDRVISEIADIGLREAYAKSISFYIRVARLTPIELTIIDELYQCALWNFEPLQFDDQIYLYFETLRESDLRPEVYWDYLLFEK